MLFSAAYVIGMLWWRIWVVPADALNIVNALILPCLLFLVGLRTASLGLAWSSRLLLCYALGGLIYVIAALAVTRSPWWDIGQVFPLFIQVPWGNDAAMNVRSVEQNAYPALLLAAPALALLAGRDFFSKRQLLLVLSVLSILGAHAVWSLNGRLGWLAFLIVMLPVLWLLAGQVRRRVAFLPFMRNHRLVRLLAICASVAVALGLLVLVVNHDGPNVWAQGFCDERLSMFASMFRRLHQAPWGGRLLRVPYESCGDQLPLLLSPHGGSIVAVHNVPLEIYYSVGVIPFLLLVAAIIPVLVVVLRGLILAWPAWDWHVVLRWSWLVFLVCQWMFQPLLYSDSLLYYFSFYVLGLLAVEASRGFSALSNVGSAEK